MKRFAEMLIAERTVVLVILLNTVALVAMGYTDPALVPDDEALGEQSLVVFSIARSLDYACVIYFIVELILKLRGWGWRRFWSSSWNRFDLVVVITSAPVLLSPFLDTHQLSVLLALRLGRLFRLFRVMRFIPNREHLYKGIKRALRASVGVFLALTVLNLDSVPPQPLLDELLKDPDISNVKVVTL